MRLEYMKVLPTGAKALGGVQQVVDHSSLDPLLLELIKVRASQINGCAHCLDMHTKDARALGATEQRLHLLPVWRDAPCYSQRERAALAWCEAITLLPQTHAPDDVYEDVVHLFSAEEAVALTLAIAMINTWNRLSVGFRLPVGEYVSHRTPVTAAR